MLSRTPVQLIEDHSEQITRRVVERIRHDRELKEMARLPESELKDRALEVLRNLGHWLSASQREEVARRYERLGRRRFEEDIPLHEVVRCLFILRDSMVDFVREQGVAQNALALYAEEELEYRVGAFFGDVVYHAVRGYELALREAVHLAG